MEEDYERQWEVVTSRKGRVSRNDIGRCLGGLGTGHVPQGACE